MVSLDPHFDSTSAAAASGRPAGSPLTRLAPPPAEGAPETAQLTLGFLPLTDAAPFIVAHRHGFFREFGLEVTLQRETSWTAQRNALNRGTTHAAHLLFSMPVASACGLLGDRQPPLIVPWILSRNGQAITLNHRHLGKVAADAKALRTAAIAGRDAGRPLVFGHTLRIGTHALWLRYWLAAGGINPDRDVALITVPPPQMADNMRIGRMDGFCVGEPWNARALAEGLGFTAITSQEIWPDHPEKVCAFTEEFAARHPRTVIATLKALHLAGVWLDNPANHPAAAALLAEPAHLNCPAEWILSRLGAAITYGDGRTLNHTHPLTFAQRGASRPRPGHAVWMLTQLRRWGLHFGEPDYVGVSSRVVRPDFHAQALLELGVAEAPSPAGPEVLFDGVPFDAAAPEAYVRQFECKQLIG